MTPYSYYKEAWNQTRKRILAHYGVPSTVHVPPRVVKQEEMA